MAIYIKGMEMPKNCEECFLVGSCTGKHWEITEGDMGYKGEYIKDNCPLTEVPEESKTKWIPISERLPDENERRKSYDRTKYASEFIVMIEGAINPTTLYLTMDNYWKDDNGVFYSVKAWMLLPNSYREDGEE